MIFRRTSKTHDGTRFYVLPALATINSGNNLEPRHTPFDLSFPLRPMTPFVSLPLYFLFFFSRLVCFSLVLLSLSLYYNKYFTSAIITSVNDIQQKEEKGYFLLLSFKMSRHWNNNVIDHLHVNAVIVALFPFSVACRPFFHPRPCVLMLHMRVSDCLGLSVSLVHFIMLLPSLMTNAQAPGFAQESKT